MLVKKEIYDMWTVFQQLNAILFIITKIFIKISHDKRKIIGENVLFQELQNQIATVPNYAEAINLTPKNGGLPTPHFWGEIGCNKHQ